MTVRLYKSTDASAPVLNGTTGSLVALLDAVLVNGYGSQPAAGWTIAYTGTSKRHYQNSPSAGTGMTLYIDDSGPGGNTFREARATGFMTATGLGTGTNQFPTVAQLNIGTGCTIIRKSNAVDSTSRPWVIVADQTAFYLFVETQDYSVPSLSQCFWFGDFFSYKASDPGRCMIVGRNNESNGGSNCEWAAQLQNNMFYTLPGHFLAQNFNGVGNSVMFGKHTDLIKSGWAGSSVNGFVGTNQSGLSNPCPMGAYASSGMVYPNPADGGLHVAPLWIHHSQTLRGYFKGLWVPMQYMPLNHLDTYAGTGTMTGKQFIAINILSWAYNSGWTPAQIHVEYSDTWS